MPRGRFSIYTPEERLIRRRATHKRNSHRYYHSNKAKIKPKLRAYYYAHRDAIRAYQDAKAVGRRAINRSLIDDCKQRPCTDCKRIYAPYVMDFDHVKGKKMRNVATMLGCSINKIMDEISKCDVVCANCHRERTHQRMLLTRTGKV